MWLLQLYIIDVALKDQEIKFAHKFCLKLFSNKLWSYIDIILKLELENFKIVRSIQRSLNVFTKENTFSITRVSENSFIDENLLKYSSSLINHIHTSMGLYKEDRGLLL